MTQLRSKSQALSHARSLSIGAVEAETTNAAQVADYLAQDGRNWSCFSCNTAMPTLDSEHASTGKVIAPKAPSADIQRFTVSVETKKWFRRNCNDVTIRECTSVRAILALAFNRMPTKIMKSYCWSASLLPLGLFAANLK